MADWAEAARIALARGPVALVTILATEGSAPRGAGARMVVTADALFGTIGGGALEYRVAEQARAILDLLPGSWRVQDYPLGPLLGQCCGGRVRLLVERLDPGQSGWIDSVEEPGQLLTKLGAGEIQRSSLPGEGRGPAAAGLLVESIGARGPLPGAGTEFIEPVETTGTPLILFGAGHVGRAIASRLPGLPFHLAWFDNRPDMAETLGVMLETDDAMIACARAAAPDAAVLILTHDHAFDYRLTAAALSGAAAFIGLIGSRTKRARFVSRLQADGIDSSRLTCPIGLPGITGKEPGVIAVATLAQLLTTAP
ncbi:xanthine dehydrogenase accessory protein XdhC [Sphingomonas oligophenolica]|uniref:Xanthine dehydrogenase accessory protein XdhC n=1 Tax=Sphingomonas oligophenolica TaxID=301154 RepID=A0ABU9Y647_9SPHN